MHRALISCLTLAGLGASLAPAASAGQQLGDLDCSQAEVIVYFQPGEASLSPQAMQMLDALAALAIPCSLASIETRAQAQDAQPGAGRSTLAAQREMAVLGALAERGLVADAQIHGASDDASPDAAFPAGRAVAARLNLLSPRVG